MRTLFSSIKFQIIFAFLLLVIPLLSLAYVIFFANTLFTETLDKRIALDELFALTSGLQRDVVDLQRNALIYKDSASASSVLNVDKLYANSLDAIESLRNIDILFSDRNVLDSIDHHLSDYKSNFDIVVGYRKQQNAYVDEHVSVELEQFSSLVSSVDMSPKNTSQVMQYLLAARNDSFSYLATSSYVYVNAFKGNILKAKELIYSREENKSDVSALISSIDKYDKNFLKAVTANRSYTYLINVVMAGSAKEILYSADFLQEKSKTSSLLEQGLAEKKLKKLRDLTLVLSIFGLVLSIFVPVYFFRSIMRPIQEITTVFDGLAQDKQVLEISGTGRVDEIGLLARSANVFRQKNEQTVNLLEQTKSSMILQKQLNDDLVSAKIRAEKALSVKTDFLANMSHELRTPLNSIIGFSVRLMKNEDGFDLRQIKALTAIHKNGKHLLAMINDILDLSKVEAGKLSVSFEELDVYELVGVCLEQLHPNIEEKKLKLIYDEPEHGLIIVSDAIRLNQVLLNLFSNAIKYTNEGWVKVEIDVDRQENAVHVCVSDSGVGIADENINKLFNRFEQLDQNTQYRIGHGTGLGLAIVANISRLLGAKVSVDSQLGVGSQFTLTLPLSQKT